MSLVQAVALTLVVEPDSSARIVAGLSRREFAAHLNVSRATVAYRYRRALTLLSTGRYCV